MLDVAVLLDTIDAVRLSDKMNENSVSNYSLNVSLSEKDRTADALVLSFSLELTSQPPAAKFKVSGTASLKGTKEEIKEEITAPDDKKPPAILITIYERVYSTLYVLAGSLKAPHPMPNLLKKAS